MGTWGAVFPHTPVPLLHVFLPSTYLTTLLLELATFVLLTIVFAKTRQPAQIVLALVFLLCGMLDAGLFLTMPLPGTPDGLLALGGYAPPYLFLLWHAALPSGAALYAIERMRDRTVTRGTARMLVNGTLPPTMVAAGCIIALIISFSNRLPHLVALGDLAGFRHSPFPFLDIALTTVAVFALVRFLNERPATGSDYAILLVVIASAVVLVISLMPIDRFSVAWFTARVLYFVSSTFVLIAAIRDLIDRFDETLRSETDALRAEARTFRQNAAVEASLVKSRFVAMVTHELRTPLGGIIGMVELLGRTSLSERQRSFTGAIHSSAGSLLRIVNDLLDFSRVESGNVELEDEPFDLGQMIDGVVMLFGEAARVHGVTVYAYIDPTLPATLRGDETRIKQILQNLVNNAVRFTPQGSIRIEVGRAAEPAADGIVVRFSVHDTGIGIAKSAQERIFAPFTQEDASTTRRFGGTGLGLAIARHLVGLMGGNITLNSVPGVGSTFTFAIPLRSALRREGAEALRDLSAFVVEEDPVVLALLKRYLEGWDIKARTVVSVADALAAARGPCDILIVGPGLPPAEITAALQRLAEHAAFASADTILLRHDDGENDPQWADDVDVCLRGTLRQSALFDAIVRLRQAGAVERVGAPVERIVKRTPRTERILVADDNEINQALLVAQLEHLGFEADVVNDGEEAVAAASVRAYQLIFVDCQMPVLDGFEAARRIRKASACANDVPIIAVTANVLPGYRELCIAAGMSDYLAKPALIAPVTAILDRWLPLPAGADPIPADALGDGPAGNSMRARLMEIFHGDEARVEAIVARSLDVLRRDAIELRRLLDERDTEGTARLAHKLTGITLEIGLSPVAEAFRSIEAAVRAGEWTAAEDAFAAGTAEIVSPPPSARTEATR